MNFFMNNASFQKFNQAYKDNILKLKNLVLVKFNLDTMVVPRESEVRIAVHDFYI